MQPIVINGPFVPNAFAQGNFGAEWTDLFKTKASDGQRAASSMLWDADTFFGQTNTQDALLSDFRRPGGQTLAEAVEQAEAAGGTVTALALTIERRRAGADDVTDQTVMLRNGDSDSLSSNQADTNTPWPTSDEDRLYSFDVGFSAGELDTGFTAVVAASLSVEITGSFEGTAEVDQVRIDAIEIAPPAAGGPRSRGRLRGSIWWRE